ncbi:tRNA (N(6)-L-threonylcarbamoyladenosine(37)-C(2))-methylthiotransferase MtaB [Clostridium felsineum]|uniref:Threonylcarbamoyladenosine tRNA methylthiotransferase MtaB n=1 Tax=Clostridium felsineum TaxID=36839 RepID=A0A1S8LAU0_9CLOT|nr:tRNA (N(6)-L-threonylcarbamoyladenosine(37)-C(2))-methylthiotransferase MtaB [Clostridium felsineum]URZ06093.1 Threonylcarbamoyladenosine tRNA methylthiotransferase MtaB [Clostridium felsineum]URZ11130.1 Threonylcarbamoyladenosine tRNA methylthiotransferase MtaB [Clostridium felsineum]
MKVAFITLGCRVNSYDSEAMAEKFLKSGWKVVNHDEKADAYVINTCTVTNMGDRKSRQMISKSRKVNENAVIAVVGCYSQVAPEKVSDIEGVDIVLGTKNKGDIVQYVNEFINERNQIVNVKDVFTDKKFEDLNIDEYQDKTRAFLKIQDGCNRFCSYCLIPYARGGVCSKDPEKVLNEIKKLAEHGFKEIILSGIHIASYGDDLKGDWNLINIVEKIEEIDGIERIRIGSIEPRFFDDETINKIKNMTKMCPHFHLSLQSGCSETLKRMNRKYTADEYKDTVDKLRKNIKDVSITTDVIVGFPGETEEEFNKTYEFLKGIELSKMHIFKYSPREGTKAADMKDQIDGNIKDKRSAELIELDKINENKFMSKFLNREMDVLFEKKFNNKEDLYEGYTPNYIKVVVKSNKDISRQILKVKLTEIKDEHLLGKLIL